ncbi:hypothetical protein BaRGS_00029748, partial [Batillaria attramentaria]
MLMEWTDPSHFLRNCKTMAQTPACASTHTRLTDGQLCRRFKRAAMIRPLPHCSTALYGIERTSCVPTSALAPTEVHKCVLTHSRIFPFEEKRPCG